MWCWNMRQKILRKPGGYSYPDQVCKLCGTCAAEDCNSAVEQYVEYHLGTCRICGSIRDQVASPRDFGFPTFYTYANGSPVRRNP